MKIALQASPFNRKDLFEEMRFDVVEAQCRTEEDLIALLDDADGAQVGTLPLVSRHVMQQCPKLRVISRMGVGVDSIDLEAAAELGILVCNVPGINTAEVADHAVAMLLSLTRLIHEASASTRVGAWGNDGRLNLKYMKSVRRIAANTVGIIGFGDIGRAFANRIRGFGPAKIVAHDPYVHQNTADLYGVNLVSLEELLTASDYITLHTSLTEETRHIINKDTLKLMKSTAILVNTSRGLIVDNAALAEALRNDQIESAALDVTEIEPIEPNNERLSLSNVVITPHLAGFSPLFLEDCPIRQAENIMRVLSGLAPHDLANPEAIKMIAVMRSVNPERCVDISDFSTSLAA